MDPRLPDCLAPTPGVLLLRRAASLVVLASLAGCATAPPVVPDQEVGAPRIYRARVIRATGGTPASTGDLCTIRVTHVRGAYFNCRIRIVCGGDLAYGLPDAGYNRCATRDDGRLLSADDDDGTRADGDPTLHLDLVHGVASIRDRDPDMDLELTVEDAIGTSTSGGPTSVPVVPPGYSHAR